MAPVNRMRKRTYAMFSESPMVPIFKEFDDIEFGDVDRRWSICVRVEAKFPVEDNGETLRFIFMDVTGFKIEAFARGRNVHRFNIALDEGCKYNIHSVGFQPNYEEVQFRAILSDPNYITSRAILSTRNEYVDRINMKMINLFRGEEMVYHSFDRAEDDPHSYYPPEFLNNLTPNGLPPHALKLKINCPVILLRNIDPANGLCNGTRLVVRGFQKNAVDAEIVLGQHAGKRVFLPRIPLCPSDDDMFPFRFKRKQFPVRLSFAMTINKAQGQTIPNVGVYLPDPVFSHGQLYVALSRATARSNIKILAVVDKEKDKRRKSRKTRGTFTKNIVYREVLTA